MSNTRKVLAVALLAALARVVTPDAQVQSRPRRR